MSSARKIAIVKKARPVSEIASSMGEAIHRLADAVECAAGVWAWMAVEKHSCDHGRQHEMAAVVLRFAKEGYYHAKVDGQKVSKADQAMLDHMWKMVFGPPSPPKRTR